MERSGTEGSTLVFYHSCGGKLLSHIFVERQVQELLINNIVLLAERCSHPRSRSFEWTQLLIRSGVVAESLRRGGKRPI